MATNAIDVLDNNDPTRLDVRGILEQYLGATNIQMERLSKIHGSEEEAKAAAAESLAKGAKAGTELVAAQQQQAVQEGQRLQQFAKNLGADVTDPQSKINISAQMYNEATGKIQEDIQSIETASNMSFVDNPAKWLAAHWALSGEYGDLKRHTKEAVALAKSMNDTNAIFQSTAGTTKALTEVTTKDMAANAVTSIGAKLTADAQNAKAELLGIQADNILKLQGLSDSQLARVIQVYGMQATNEQRQLIHEQRQQAANDKDQLTASVNQGLRVFGLPSVSYAAINNNKKYYEFFNELGAQSLAGIETIGNSPGEAAMLMTKYHAALTGPLPNTLKDVKDEVISGISKQMGKIDDNSVTTGINTYLFGQTQKNGDRIPGLLDAMATHSNLAKIPFQGKTYDNFYAIPDMTTVVSANKEVLNSTFGQKVLKPSLDAPVAAAKSSDPMQLLDAAASTMVTDGIKADDMAGGIAHFYKTAVAFNNFHKHYKQYNLPPQQVFIVNGIDMTDAAAVSRYLTRQAVKLNLKRVPFPF